MGCDHLLVAVTLLDFLEEVLQTEAQGGTFGQPDRQTFAHHVGEHEQLQFFADLAVVAFLGFFEERQVLVEHGFLGEGYTVDTGHHGSCLVAAPVSGGAGEHFDRLDRLGREEVRSFAEVRKIALCIGGYMSVLEVRDQFAFIALSLVGEGFEGVLFGDGLFHQLFFLGSQFHHFGFDGGEVGVFDHDAFGGHDVIVEAVFDSRTDTELDTGIELLQGFRHEV